MRNVVVPPRFCQSPGDLWITRRELKWVQRIVVCTFDCNCRRIHERKEKLTRHFVRGDSAFLSCDAKGKEPS